MREELTEDTLEVLTWENLGYRLGWLFGETDEALMGDIYSWCVGPVGDSSRSWLRSCDGSWLTRWIISRQYFAVWLPTGVYKRNSAQDALDVMPPIDEEQCQAIVTRCPTSEITGTLEKCL